MKAITIATILAVVSTPALARKADHPRHAKHRHAYVVATDTQTPFGSWPIAMSTGWNAQARAPRVARDAAHRGRAPIRRWLRVTPRRTAFRLRWCIA